MILVVGATGQLGSAIVGKLVAAGQPVRIFVRPNSHYHNLIESGQVEVAFGDLRDKLSLEMACKGIETVIATANNVLPGNGPKGSFEEIEGQGYDNLIKACQQQGVKKFIFISVPVSNFDNLIPTMRYKRRIEQQLQSSGLAYLIFRGSVFMDVWFALIGSSTVLRGNSANSMNRPFWLANFLMKVLGGSIEKRGRAFVPGTGNTRHAFITIDDAASIITNAIDRPEATNTIFEMGGPEVLSWDEVAAIFGKVLGKEVKPVHTPPPVYRAGILLFKPFSETASNLMGLNLMASRADTPYADSRLTPFISQPLTTVEQFITQKKALV
jgi:uncharacterized protein YbjT (DUF2867 family)